MDGRIRAGLSDSLTDVDCQTVKGVVKAMDMPEAVDRRSPAGHGERAVVRDKIKTVD